MEHWHPNPGFFFRPGGGPVFDMGPYFLTALVTLLGPVASVQAIGQIGFVERTVTTPGSAMLGRTIRVETLTSVQGLLEFASARGGADDQGTVGNRVSEAGEVLGCLEQRRSSHGRTRFAKCGFRREVLLPVYGLAEASLAVTIPPVDRGPRVDRLDRAAFEQVSHVE